MSELIVTEVEIAPVKFNNGLIGFGECTINNALHLSGIAIYTLRNGQGFRLVFPTKVLKNGTSIQLVYPINSESANILSNAIINRYKEIIGENN